MNQNEMPKMGKDEAHDLANEMEKRMAPDGKNYDEVLGQVENEKDNPSVLIVDAHNKMQSVKVGSPEHETLRNEYREIVEKTFQKFISEYGEAKFDDMKQFVVYMDNFYAFMKEEISPKVMIDMGFRFNIETALSNSNISENNKQILNDYLIKIGPFDGRDFKEIDNLKKEVINQSEDKALLIEDLSAVIKVSFVLGQVAVGPEGVLCRFGDNINKIYRVIEEKNINVFDGADAQFIEIWGKDRGSYFGAIEHPVLYMSNDLDFRKKIANMFELKFDEDREDAENRKEVVSIYKKDFNIDLEAILQKIEE